VSVALLQQIHRAYKIMPRYVWQKQPSLVYCLKMSLTLETK